MELTISDTLFERTLYGLSGPVENHDYASTGLALMGNLWNEVETKGFDHFGINHWVYEASDQLFVGVELKQEPGETMLRKLVVHLERHAHHQHVGPYHLLAEVHGKMHDELNRRGLRFMRPAMEIYGHWEEDEAKLETDVLMALERAG